MSKFQITIPQIEHRLQSAGVYNPRFESKILYEYMTAAGMDEEAVEYIIARRISREPLQYIIGEWEFYGDTYKLNAACLIPRTETEFLTQFIIDRAEPNSTFADLCSGSGCVAISALKRRSDLSCVAVEISPEAVEAAKVNAELNGVAGRIRFIRADLKKDTALIKEEVKECLLLVSNPPYLSCADMDKVRVEKTEVSYEPETALDGGGDGYDFYRIITEEYLTDVKIAAFEVGAGQHETVAKMLRTKKFSADIILDYAKIERIVCGYKIV